MEKLGEKVARLRSGGVFLGGPPDLFEVAGQKLLMALLSEGLRPGALVLDIGCGCLRGGYWLIHFLDERCYCGIEPNVAMLEAGTRILLEPGLAEAKKPRFDHGSEFDLTVFDERFDFFVARSIWTHASKRQIQTMLDGFQKTANPEAVFLASYIPAASDRDDYVGEAWVGRSHDSDAPGMVRHRLDWIQDECAGRGLCAEEITDPLLNFGSQVWLKISVPSQGEVSGKIDRPPARGVRAFVKWAINGVLRPLGLKISRI